MDIVNLLLSAATGALFGAIASLYAASRIARGSELGRVQEEARQRLVAQVRLYRSRVDAARETLSLKPAMEKDYMLADAALEWAEGIERDLIHAPSRLASDVRAHIGRIVGPVASSRARTAAFLPVAERRADYEAISFLRAAEGLSEDQIEDHGLLGAARDLDADKTAARSVLAELDAMEETLNRGRIGLLRR